MSKHPYNRLVFSIGSPTLRYSLRTIQSAVMAGTLDPHTLVSDVDGGRYTAGSIASGKAPKWARTAEHDPLLFGMPPLSELELAAADEVLCEPDFLEMPCE